MTARKSNCKAGRETTNLLDGVLEQRLLLYTLAAGAALASARPAQAEIVFTPSSEVYHAFDSPFLIDMDNDGSMDFMMFSQIRGCTSTTRICTLSYGLRRVGQLDNDIALADCGRCSEAALKKGATIGESHRFGPGFMVSNNNYGGYGSWGNVQHRYLGVKFLIGSEVHYGWIGFRSVFLSFTAAFQGWAYETEPNKRIRAGDKGTGELGPTAFDPAEPTSLELLSAGHAANADWLRRKID